MDNWFKKNWELMVITLVVLLLFYKALFSNQPLGLDAIGHLSKVSYISQFPFANWDMSWYSGSLFLKMYPPLFYYITSLFSNVFFGSNLICFLSLLFTSVGIYLLIKYLTKDRKLALLLGLSFLTVLSISYYWIATGNLPYFAALWTIPFSLYFLEMSIREDSNKYKILYFLVFAIGIITHVVTGFLIGLFMIIRFLSEGFDFKNIKKMFFYGGIPVLLSAFWFIPFVYFSSSAGEYTGYIPKLLQLFGIIDLVAWGFHAGGIGVVLFGFLLILFFNYKKMPKSEKYYLSLSGVLGFLLMGGLWKYYPYGVDPVRFILPFSITLIITASLLIARNKLLKRRLFVILLIVALVAGLAWNYSIANQNLERFSYYKEDSRYGIFNDILDKGLPFDDKFENYRFGTSKFIFGEMLTHFMPSVPQTFGYQDAGMLDAPHYYDMRWHIWTSEDVNDSIYWLDWFGIKYFEVEDSEVSDKFVDDSRFDKILNYSNGYVFTMYEYLDAKPIISLVDNLEEEEMGQVKDSNFGRSHPDRIQITYNSTDSDDVILFKDFYHKDWRAKELITGAPLEIIKVGPGFMGVYPEMNSEGVVFYYKKNMIEYISYLLSLIGVISLFFVRRIEKILKVN